MKKEYLHGVQFFRTSDWPSAYLAMTLSARVPYNETVMCVPFQNGQTLDHILSHLDPIHTKKKQVFKTHCQAILSSARSSSRSSLPFRVFD